MNLNQGSNPFAGFQWNSQPTVSHQSFGHSSQNQTDHKLNNFESHPSSTVTLEDMGMEQGRKDSGAACSSVEDSFFDVNEYLDNYESDEVSGVSGHNDSGIPNGHLSPENRRKKYHEALVGKGSKRRRRQSSASSSESSTRYDRLESQVVNDNGRFNKRKRNEAYDHKSHVDSVNQDEMSEDKGEGFIPISNRNIYPIDVRGYLTWKQALSSWQTRYPTYWNHDTPFAHEAIDNLQARISHFQLIRRTKFAGYIFNMRRHNDCFPKLTPEQMDTLMSYTCWRYQYECCEQAQLRKPSKGNLEQLHNISAKMHRVEEEFTPEYLVNCLFSIGVDIDSKQ